MYLCKKELLIFVVGDTPYAYFDFASFFLTAECNGVFAPYRFRCALGELGRFREGTGFREPDPGFDGFRQVLRFQGSGSEGCVKEVSKVSVFDGFRGVRFCSRSFDGTVSGNRVPGARGIEKVPGQGFRHSYLVLRRYTFLL